MVATSLKLASPREKEMKRWYTIHNLKSVLPEKGEYTISSEILEDATTRKRAKAAAIGIAARPGPHRANGMAIWDHAKGIDGLMLWHPLAGIVDFGATKKKISTYAPVQPRTIRWEWY
jgi:hypothetical protein